MKHIKVRILATIWVSIFLLFVPFYIILNLTLPVHFEKEAKAALTYEMEYMSRSRSLRMRPPWTMWASFSAGISALST
mgnify:CR=1 FL=1